MKLTELPVPAETADKIKSIIVADDGSVAILYHGRASVHLKSRGDGITANPITVGPSFQVRMVGFQPLAPEAPPPTWASLNAARDPLRAAPWEEERDRERERERQKSQGDF
jgi:hypothetical protein